MTPVAEIALVISLSIASGIAIVVGVRQTIKWAKEL